jgi:hypothetical protein
MIQVVAFVYHLCSDDFRVQSLLPLNTLRTEHPEVYGRERVKWAGRESVLSWQVPHLGVPWGDTVNLAASTLSTCWPPDAGSAPASPT